jgi:hypothetical protein
MVWEPKAGEVYRRIAGAQLGNIAQGDLVLVRDMDGLISSDGGKYGHLVVLRTGKTIHFPLFERFWEKVS